MTTRHRFLVAWNPREDEGNDRVRILTALLSILIFALVMLEVYKISRLFDTDFLSYWAAGSALLQGHNPYNARDIQALERQEGFQGSEALMMNNPPWALVIVLPFSLLPFGIARTLWLLFLAGSLLCASDWTWRTYGGAASLRWLSWLSAVFFMPAFHALILGQFSPIVLGGIALYVSAIGRKRYFLAGLLGLPISSKPQLLFLFWIVMILWSIRTRCWRLLMGVGASLGGAVSLLSFFNPRLALEYLEFVWTGQPMNWMTATAGMALRYVVDYNAVWLQFIPSIVGIAWCLLLWHPRWKHSFSWRDQLMPLLLLSTMTTFFAWTHDMTVLLPCVIIGLIWVTKEPWRNFWFPVAIFLLDALYIWILFATHNILFTFWMPWAMATLFLVGYKLNCNGHKFAGTG